MSCKRFIFIGFCIIFCVGCVSSQPRPLGFLSSYELMRESPKVKGLFFSKDPSVKIKKYRQIIVDPVFVFGKNIDLDKYEEQYISDYFKDELQEAFYRSYAVSDDPELKDVVHIHAAVEVWPSEPILNIHFSTSLPAIGIGGASIEVEFFDAEIDQTILSFMASEKGDRFNKIDGFSRWAHTEKVLKKWANEIKSIFDEFQGK